VKKTLIAVLSLLTMSACTQAEFHDFATRMGQMSDAINAQQQAKAEAVAAYRAAHPTFTCRSTSDGVNTHTTCVQD
jgi:hypothetical protein